MTRLRIAIIGSRGIPAHYGGFESLAEELAPRLVEMGHEVTVYCRAGYTGDEMPSDYKGVRLVYTPYLRLRALETLSHELSSILSSLLRRFDVYYFLGTRSAPLYVPLRLSSRAVVVHTDGLEWKRRKWNAVGRVYLKFAEWVAARFAADRLVTDAEAMRAYYLRRYDRDSTYLAYGAHVLSELPEGALDPWSLHPGDYYLAVCRIEPENNVDLIVREFLESGSERSLVVVGGSAYDSPFARSLPSGEDRVRFIGPVYGPMALESLYLGAYAYLHGHEVGGTNPSMIRAMGCGACTLALDTEFNAESLAACGLLWTKEPGSLAGRIEWADANPDEVVELGRRARERVAEHYTWEQVAAGHDRLFRDVAKPTGREAAEP